MCVCVCVCVGGMLLLVCLRMGGRTTDTNSPKQTSQSAIVFYGCAMQGSFVFFSLIMCAGSMVALSIAYAMASVCPSLEIATTATTSLVTILTVLSGFMIRESAIPVRVPLLSAWRGAVAIALGAAVRAARWQQLPVPSLSTSMALSCYYYYYRSMRRASNQTTTSAVQRRQW